MIQVARDLDKVIAAVQYGRNFTRIYKKMTLAKKLDKTFSGLQKTLKQSLTLRGIGLHSGKSVEMTIHPAMANSGITFVRTDLPGHPEISASTDNVFSSRLCTVLRNDSASVRTVEHLLSSLYGLGVDNAQVCVNSEELPILDGSAMPYVAALQDVGLRELPMGRAFFKVRRDMEVRDGVRYIKIRPSWQLRIDCTVDFHHPLVNNQNLVFNAGVSQFVKNIAPARTFGFLKDVKTLRKEGMAKGGTLQNAIVIDRFAILNPGGLRFADEFVRHKILDILGDLALLGHPLMGEIEASRSGHELHHKLIRKLVATRGCLEKVQVGLDGQTVEPADQGLVEPGLQSA